MQHTKIKYLFRAFYESRGRGFESLLARQAKYLLNIVRQVFFCFEPAQTPGPAVRYTKSPIFCMRLSVFRITYSLENEDYFFGGSGHELEAKPVSAKKNAITSRCYGEKSMLIIRRYFTYGESRGMEYSLIFVIMF